MSDVESLAPSVHSDGYVSQSDDEHPHQQDTAFEESYEYLTMLLELKLEAHMAEVGLPLLDRRRIALDKYRSS